MHEDCQSWQDMLNKPDTENSKCCQASVKQTVMATACIGHGPAVSALQASSNPASPCAMLGTCKSWPRSLCLQQLLFACTPPTRQRWSVRMPAWRGSPQLMGRPPSANGRPPSHQPEGSQWEGKQACKGSTVHTCSSDVLAWDYGAFNSFIWLDDLLLTQGKLLD